MAAATTLTQAQIDGYRRDGYLHLPDVFSADEIAQLSAETDTLLDRWAMRFPLPGGWRSVYMDAATEASSQLEVIHNLHRYSGAWREAAGKAVLVDAVAALLNSSNVEFHHSTLHTKPPRTGDPFPLHQDYWFFAHRDPDRFIETLVHLDDTSPDNGEIRFLRGSHTRGPIDHTMDGFYHLPPDRYPLADAVAVPARAGDVICFHLCAAHGSDLNRTAHPRRVVRMAYRDPANQQLSGDGLGQVHFMVRGLRPRGEGQEPYPHD